MTDYLRGQERRAPLLTVLAAGLALTVSIAWGQTLKHDENNRLTEITYPDGNSRSFDYDAAGNIVRIAFRFKYKETPWHTVWFYSSENFTPVRVNSQGQIECASNDGANCFWGRTVEDMPSPTQPIFCRPEWEGNETHWCGQLATVLKAQWTRSTVNNKEYTVVACGKWIECETKAQFAGGHLTSIDNPNENAWLTSRYAMNLNYWIGATNDGIVGAWRWTDGAEFGYTNWGGNLNNFDGQEFCAHYYDVTPGFWNDIRCDSPGLVLGIFQR